MKVLPVAYYNFNTNKAHSQKFSGSEKSKNPNADAIYEAALDNINSLYSNSYAAIERANMPRRQKKEMIKDIEREKAFWIAKIYKQAYGEPMPVEQPEQIEQSEPSEPSEKKKSFFARIFHKK